MDWKSHRVDVLLEQALLEDQAPHDATTQITIDSNLLAAGSIIAREELVVAGLGAIPRFFEIYARLDQSPKRRPALRSSAIRKSLTACAFTPGRCLPLFATTRASCSVASA